MIVTVPSPHSYSGATLTLHIDETEHARRQQAGLGVAIGHGFAGLDTLMALPEGMPVPLDELTDRQRAYVHGAPVGVCAVAGGQVTRLAVRPCRVTMATVHCRRACTLCLNCASQFAPFSARHVVVERTPDPRTDADQLMDFAFYGVGVTVHAPGGEPEVWLEPRPPRPVRHTAASWWFAETAYGQYLAQQPAALAAAETPKET